MKLLVISGGRHPYEESTPVLERFLKGAGHDITVTEDPSVLANAPDLNSYDALVFNTRRENIPDFGEWALSSSEQNGMKDFISSGKGFVCLHISTCLPGGWPEYHDITGGGWISGTSFHPPYGRFTVNISNSGHPGVNGVANSTPTTSFTWAWQSPRETTCSSPAIRKTGHILGVRTGHPKTCPAGPSL